MPKQAFSGKFKKGEKISCQRDHFLATKWKDIHDVFFLTTAKKKKRSLEISYEKVAKGLVASADTETQVQSQSSSPAGRLVGRDHSVYRIPVKQAKLEGKSKCSCHVCVWRKKQASDWENCAEMHYTVLP